ncbi:MAG: hypothetical protein J6V65_02950 [Fibrobacterales bacterium]|nr:hypothetical protein [Fibrobacterales bacterium]
MKIKCLICGLCLVGTPRECDDWRARHELNCKVKRQGFTLALVFRTWEDDNVQA